MTTALSDILTPSMYADGIPHEVLRDLRREHAVVWVDEPATETFAGGRGYWLVLRHAEVSHVSRHPEDFSSWRGTSFLRDQRPTDVAVLRRMMLNMDPPEHSSLRKIVNRAFTPKVIRQQLFEAIKRHACEVVDAVCETGETDFLANVAAEMPLLVLADVLGVPPEDRKLLYSWTNRLVGIDDPEYGGDPQGFLSAFTEMFAYCRAATKERRTRPTEDLWSTVVNAEVDGEFLSDDDLDRFFQLLVIAGNDTTRNLLANTMLTLSEHPNQLARLREDLSLLPGAVEEVLRFSPSVIQFRRTATRDLELAGQSIAEDDRVIINYASANRDESVFADPDRFDITRDTNPHISFGDGTHYCLGANLARLQVQTLLTELFTRLPDIEVSGEASHMQSSFMNGIKHLPVRFTPAERRGPLVVAGVDLEDGPAEDDVAAEQPAAPGHATPMLVLFGSNFGTAEEVADDLANAGRARGFDVRVSTLDEAVDDLPTQGVVLIATATYNGTPPDNAVRFAEWITAQAPDLSGVKFGVFGCGNHEWAPTFQDFPRLVDSRLEELGATRLHSRGEGDVAADFDGDLQTWETALWPSLAEALGIDLGAVAGSYEPRLRIEFLPSDRPSPFVESLDARPMRIIETRELTTPDGPVAVRPVRHVELQLPKGVTYQAGDHLGVIPHNSDALVARVTQRFDLEPDAWVRLVADHGVSSFLPVGERVTVRHLISDYVELQGVAGRRDIERLLEHTEYPWTRARLERLLDGDTYRAEVLARRISVLDLLEMHPTCRLPFEVFLELLSPLSPRYYSISSSPRVQPDRCSITVGALVGEARSGNGTFHGTCSSYLFAQEVGRVVHAFVRDTASSFRLPSDPSVPVVMVAAGTGLAPFRGFLQDRAAARRAGTDFAPSLLLFGCRHPQSDELYRGELEQLAEAAGVQLACAYSRVPDLPRVYVQDRLQAMGAHVMDLLERGGALYVCGAAAMADGVRSTLLDLRSELCGEKAEDAEAWLQQLTEDRRWLVDVWATG
ncbi:MULTISPECIES: cytochrome P450 [Nocardioides]|uniref:NADPH--hemoprotein reductase n=1 Tax=Nocardioides vastitatis TaxID=2568655 RepID=A0ABW0ZLM2_9ACTN|nr:cytochrome P450 [Nocardioides sp.]THJ04303.1 cytochrome P450 [Nocardioides sp.]